MNQNVAIYFLGYFSLTSNMIQTVIMTIPICCTSYLLYVMWPLRLTLCIEIFNFTYAYWFYYLGVIMCFKRNYNIFSNVSGWISLNVDNWQTSFKCSPFKIWKQLVALYDALMLSSTVLC